MGKDVISKIVFVCSDMWEPYLKLIRENCSEALHILDRFHIVANMKAFQQLWDYSSHAWAGTFLDEWCRQTMRSRIEPMKKIARSLRNHRELILNYFRAQKTLSSGVVEGLNNKAKVTMRKSYGFRTYRVLELALYHSLGKLPEPESTTRFLLTNHKCCSASWLAFCDARCTLCAACRSRHGFRTLLLARPDSVRS